MRDIKFRAWDKVRKEFLSGGMVLISIEPGKRPQNNPIYLDILDNPDRYRERFILMQYTGLRDKNWREIYEGDIVTAWSEGVRGTFQVKWREDGGGTPCLLLYPAWQHGQMWRLAASREEDGIVYDRGIEIIGNIYDNPDLIKTS